MNATIDVHRCRISRHDRRDDRPSRPDRRAAETYSEWFATLSDPTRVRLLHTVATSPRAPSRRGPRGTARDQSVHLFTPCPEAGRGRLRAGGQGRHQQRGLGQPVVLHRTPTRGGRRHGHAPRRAVLPRGSPHDVTVRAAEAQDMAAVLDIYAEGVATRNATFETRVPDRQGAAGRWLPGHAWVAEREGEVVGWTALTRSPTAPATPVSLSPRSTSPSRRAATALERRCSTPR